LIKAYQDMQLAYLKENLSYDTIEEFLNTKYKATSKSYNKTFYDLLYLSQFKYDSIINLSPIKFKLNNLKEFLIQTKLNRFEKINLDEKLKIVDEKSKKVYNDVLQNTYMHKVIPDLTIHHFIEKEVGYWIEEGIIEEYPQGHYVKIVKWFDDVVVLNRKRIWFDLQLYKFMNTLPFDKCVITTIKTKDKYYLVDIDVGLNQIERSQLLGRLYYQFDKTFKKLFALPVIHRLTYHIKDDTIHLVKLPITDKKIIKVKGLKNE